MLIIKMEYKVRNFRFPLKVLQNNKKSANYKRSLLIFALKLRQN